MRDTTNKGCFFKFGVEVGVAESIMNAPQCSVTTVTNVNLFEINLNFQFVSYKMVFSQEQKIYIVESYFRNGHLIDGEWQYSIEACFEEFRLQFPDAALTYNIFHHNLTQCIQIFRETGSVDRKKGSGRPTKRTEEAIANVRQVMDEVPRTSVRRLSQQVQLSTSSCHNILKKDIHLYPYRLQAVQQLLEADYPVRVEYCHWFLNTMNENLLNWSFFSDESWFYLDGYVNSQNMRWWSSEKPNFFEQVPLHPQKVGVWAAISRRRIIGPIFFNGTNTIKMFFSKKLTMPIFSEKLTAVRYREIIQQFFEQLHDDEIVNGYFQQDGAPAHTTLETLNMIQEFFDRRVISRNTAIAYPSRSCDLTPCDFFLWPYLKNSIFQHRLNNLDELREAIVAKIDEINNNPQMLANVSTGIVGRVRKCLEVDGAHFDYLL
jgi:hypothetical protein